MLICAAGAAEPCTGTSTAPPSVSSRSWPVKVCVNEPEVEGGVNLTPMPIESPAGDRHGAVGGGRVRDRERAERDRRGR